MPVISATGTIASPAVGGEVTLATIAGGPLDNVSAFVQGGASLDGQGQNRYCLYALVGIGGLLSLVAESTVLGSRTASVLKWQIPASGSSSSQFVEAGGTSYVLKVTPLPLPTPQVRGTITATLAGVNEFDVAPSSSISPVVVVPPFYEMTSPTIGGFAQYMDVSVNQVGLPQSVTLTIYANNGPSSVEAAVARVTLSGPDDISAALRKIQLPAASFYRVGVGNNTGSQISVPIAIASYSVTSAAAGAVILAGDVIGPSGANTVVRWEGQPLDPVTMGSPAITDLPQFTGGEWIGTDAATVVANAFTAMSPAEIIQVETALSLPSLPGMIEAVNRDVLVGEFTPVHSTWYVGISGLTANHTVNIPAMTPGSRVIIKDEDGSLEFWNISVVPAAGKTIDGVTPYEMTAAQNGVKGVITILMNNNVPTEWSIV